MPTDKIETGTGREGGMSMTMDTAGKMQVSSKESGGVQSLDVTNPAVVDGNNDPIRAGKSDADKAADAKLAAAAGDAPDDAADDAAADAADKADAPAGDLPEFAADDPEVVKAYDEKYATGGKLNLEALSADWWKNAGGDTSKGKLDDGAYAYLETKFGLPKERVQEIEQGELAKQELRHQGLQKQVGGADAYQKLVAWGRDGGYTPEQKSAFNAAINGSDPAKAAEALELLQSRYEKASKSRVRPDTTAAKGGKGGQGGAGGDVFSTKDDWVKARKEAGNNNTKQQAVADKFMRSPAAKTW